jgi:hypothetical protein
LVPGSKYFEVLLLKLELSFNFGLKFVLSYLVGGLVMADHFPKKDRESVAYAERAIAAFEADEVAYGMTEAESADLRTKELNFVAALDAADAAKAAASTAVAAKDEARLALEEAYRPIYNRIQVSQVVTDAARTSAGLPLRDTTRTFVNPIPPRDLVARADATGTNVLTFNANGNTSGAQFVVEARIGAAAEFSLVNVTTATTFKHTGQTPGVRTDYRVRARRGAAISDPSNVASVYVQ